MSTQISISPIIKLEVNTTPITGGNAGQVLFQTTSNTVGESANLFWDNPNGRLGIGTSSPSFVLDVNGVSRIQTFQSGTPTILNIHNQETNGLPGGAIAFYTGGSSSSASRIVSQRTGPIGESDIALETTGVKRLFVTATSGNVLINTTTDAGYKLDVNGTARVQGVITGSIPAGALTLGAASANQTAVGIIGYFSGNGAITTSNYNARSFNTNIGGQSLGYASYYNGNNQASSSFDSYFLAGGSINITNGTIDLNGFVFGPSIVSETNATIKAFSSGLAAASNRWNLFLSGTAKNYIQGSLGIGLENPVGKTDILTGFADASSLNQAETFRLRSTAVDGNTRVMNFGLSHTGIGGANQGYGYIQFGYSGGSLDNPLVLQPLGGGVSVGSTVATSDYKLQVLQESSIKASANSGGGALGGRLSFPFAGSYSGKVAYIAQVQDTTNWFQSAGLVFATLNGSDISASTGVERMRIGGNGNVLINTTTDAGYKLDINGTTRIQNTLTVSSPGFFALNTANAYVVDTGSNNYRTSNILQWYGYSSGAGTNNTLDAFAVGGNSSSTANAGYFFRVNLAGGNSSGPYGASGNNVSLAQLNAPTASRFYITAQGGGGVIDGSTNGFLISTIADGQNLSIRSEKGAGGSGGGINYLSSINGTNHSHRFFHNNVEQMRLQYSGNLLINTTIDSGFRLDVDGSMRGTNGLTLTGGLLKVVGLAGAGTAFTIVDDNGSFIRNSTWNYDRVTLNTWVGGTQQASSVFTLNSTTKGFLPPKMTNAQMLAIATPVSGLMVYDTTNNKLCCYDGTTWQNLF